jgi:hypothetical protein
MVAEFPRGGTGPFPIPQISIPGYSFGGTPSYGYGVGFPGLFGIGSGGLEIGPLTIPFGGPSKQDVTKSAISRLRGTGIPALQRLAGQLQGSGLFTSSSNPADQARMGTFVHEAVQSLEAQGFPRTRAFNIVSDVISNRPTGRISAPAVAQPAPAMFAPSRPNVDRFVGGFGRQVIPQVTAALGGLVASELGLPVQPAEALGEAFGQEVVENPLPQFQLQQSAPSFPRSGPQPSLLHPLPALKDCPECGFTAPQHTNGFLIDNQPQPQLLTDQGRQPVTTQQVLQDLQRQPTQQQQLQQESRQLQQETQVETQQATQQQITQIQQKLDQLQQLETQPVESRDVQQEIQQKNELARQIQNLQQGLEPTPQLHLPPPTEPQVPGQPLPPLQMQPTPQLQPQPQPQPQLQPVRFCMDCTSQTESHKFLNGEPSECVIAVV